MRKQKLKILFRTSGGRASRKELGFGHIYRCLNLAHHMKNISIYFLVEDYGGLEKIFDNSGYTRIIYLKKNSKIDHDIKETLKLLNKEKIDVLIVDKYGVSTRYLKELRKHVKVVFISDLKKIDLPADLVFNGFIGFTNKITINKFASKCFLGPLFQILNKNFSHRKKLSTKKYKLLVTFGGFDEKNIVKIFLKELSKHRKKIKTKIILGPASKSKEIKKLKKDYDGFITIVQQTKNMYKEIVATEFGLCSGGITSYEFAATNVPFAIICQAKHQLKTAQEWQKKGFGLNLGLVNKKTGKKIENFLDLIHGKSLGHTKSRSIVDGLGAKRVAREILKLKL